MVTHIYNLNYDIDYSSINYSSGPFTAYNGLNVAAVGTPTNYNLNLSEYHRNTK